MLCYTYDLSDYFDYNYDEKNHTQKLMAVPAPPQPF
jgi:hypothetical protein